MTELFDDDDLKDFFSESEPKEKSEDYFERPVKNDSPDHKSDYIPESDMLDWLPPRVDGKKPQKSKVPEINEEEFELKDSTVFENNENDDDFPLEEDLSLNEDDLSGIGESSDTSNNDYVDKEKLKSIVPDGGEQKVTKSQVFREYFGVDIKTDHKDEKENNQVPKEETQPIPKKTEDTPKKEKKDYFAFLKKLKWKRSPKKKKRKIKKSFIKRKKIGFLRKSWLTLFSLICIFLLSYMTPVFMEKEPAFWYLPIIFISVFVLYMLIAIKKGLYESALNLILFFSLIIPVFLLIRPFNLKSIEGLIKNLSFIPYFYILSSYYLIWTVATNKALAKKMRLFLLLVGSYGFIGFIPYIKSKLSMNRLLSYSYFNFIPGNYDSSFYIFLNIFIPILVLTYFFYLFVFLFKMKFTSLLSTICTLIISLMLFVSGNLSYHYNHDFTPITKILPGFKKIDLSVSFNRKKADENTLSKFYYTLKSDMTKEVTFKNGSLKVSAHQKELSQGISQYFPRSSRIISLEDDILYVTSRNNSKSQLINSKISCYSVSFSGSFIVYSNKSDNKIKVYELGKNSTITIDSPKYNIDELAISENGKNIISRSKDKIYLYIDGKKSYFKKSGQDYIFSPIGQNTIFYSSWDENYGSYSIWKNNIIDKKAMLIIFDNKDKYLPTPSPDGKFIAYIHNGKNLDIWLSDIDGNGKKLLFSLPNEIKKVNALSWNYDGSKLLVSTGKANFILTLNVQKEYTVNGNLDHRMRLLKKSIESLGIEIRKINISGNIFIKCTFSDKINPDTITRISLLTYKFIPEVRSKTLNLAFQGYGSTWETDILLSSIPFFSRTKFKDWINNIKWREN